MANKVWLSKQNIIEQEYRGKQTDRSVDKAVADTLKLIKRLRRADKPVLMLVNLSNIKRSGLASRSAAAKALEENPYDRIAIYGADTFNALVSKIIVRAVGKSHKVRVFSTRQQALQWLKQVNQ